MLTNKPDEPVDVWDFAKAQFEKYCESCSNLKSWHEHHSWGSTTAAERFDECTCEQEEKCPAFPDWQEYLKGETPYEADSYFVETEEMKAGVKDE